MSFRSGLSSTAVIVLLVLLASFCPARAEQFPHPSQFGAPVAVPGMPGGVSGVTMTPDGQTMVFNWFTGPWRIYTAQWDAERKAWGNFRHMPFPGSYNQHPSLSPDGDLLFWVEAGSAPGVVWVARRQPDGNSWGNEQRVPLPHRTNAGSAAPYFDGNRLYYSQVTNMPNGDMWYEMYYVLYDAVTNTFSGAPTPVASLNLQYPELTTGMRVFGDGKTALFSQARSGIYYTHIWLADWDAVTMDWVNPRLPDWPLYTANVFGEYSPWYCEATRTLYYMNDYTVYQSIANQIPVANAGANQYIVAVDDLTEVRLDGSQSYDLDGDVLAFEWSVAEGSGATIDDPSSDTPSGLFPVGQTLVTLVVTDGKGGTDTDDVLITVDDTSPLVTCTTDKTMLWPPNHNIVDVAVCVYASDNFTDMNELVVAATVRSSEPDDAAGDGEFSGDVNGEDGYSRAVPLDMTFDCLKGCLVGTVGLRAERDGRQENRRYSIVCEVRDLAGNRSTASCVVVVPHDRRK